MYLLSGAISLHQLVIMTKPSLSCLLCFLCMLAIPIFPFLKFEEFLIYLYICIATLTSSVLIAGSLSVFTPWHAFGQRGFKQSVRSVCLSVNKFALYKSFLLHTCRIVTCIMHTRLMLQANGLQAMHKLWSKSYMF